MLLVHSIETFGTHEGPGIRLVVFLQGCLMRCAYCHNPDTQSLKNPQAKQISNQEILEKLENEKTYFGQTGGLTVSGGEPTLQAQDLLELFTEVRSKGFHVALDTCGAIYNETINQLYDETDLVLLDVKHIDSKIHQEITGHTNENTLKNAAYREKSGKPMWLRYVLVPGLTDQEEHLHQWAQHFQDYQHIERVEILPYHTLGVYKYKELGIPYRLEGAEPPSAEQVEKAKQIFAEYLDPVYIR